MKLKIILIALMFIGFSVKSICQTIDESSVPAAIKKSFSAKYKITGSADWEKSDEGYTAAFYVGNYKGNATFQEDGTVVKSDLEIDPATVPEAVKNYIDENFKGLKIDYARKYEFMDKKGNYFYVTAPKITKDKKKIIPEFSISPTGKLISENVPAELEPYRTKESAPAKTEAETKPAPGQKKPAGKPAGKPSGTTAGKPAAKGSKPIKNLDTSIPQPVTDHFTKKFKLANDTKWDTQDNYYIANFTVKEQKNRAYYNKNGNYEKLQTEMNPKILPPAITKSIITSYPGQKVESAINTTTSDNQKYYEIVLNQKKDKETVLSTTVWMNMTGQVIKEILPEGMGKEEEAGTGISKSDIPAEVKKTFNLKFAKAPNVNWEKNDANYIATFFFKGDKTIAEYAGTGEWIQTTKSVAQAKLPPQVQTLLQSKYKKEKVSSSQYIETSDKQKYYAIDVKEEGKKGKPAKITHLKVSPVGKLIDQVADEENPEDNTPPPVNEPVKKTKVEKQEVKNKSEKTEVQKKEPSEADLKKEQEEQEKAIKQAEEDNRKKEEKAIEEQKKLEEKSKKEEEKKLKKKKKVDEDFEKEFNDSEKDKEEKPNK
jgi:hypothetical protein